MTSSLFKVFAMLETHSVHYTIERTRPDTVRVNATLVGERLEIEVFEDDHVEISRFRGNEDVEGDLSLLAMILRDDASPTR